MNLKDFQNFALKKKSVANPPPNYKYKGQCVSLIQQLLYNVYNLPFKAYGNAKDWGTNDNLLINFKRLSSSRQLESGDILVYPATYSNEYGHLGFIGSDGKYYDQNGIKHLEVGCRNTPLSNYTKILRYKYNPRFEVRVDKPKAMVRSGPSTAYGLSGSKELVRGNTFVATTRVLGQSVNGNNVWFRSYKGNYVWSGGLTEI